MDEQVQSIETSAEEPSKIKACLKRAYITWLWIFIPFLGFPAPSETKNGIIVSAATVASICAFVSMFYPTNRKIVYVPISWFLAIALLAAPYYFLR